MITVDPKVHDLAREFVDDVAAEFDGPLPRDRYESLVQQVAIAAQQALEDECEAIRQELRS
jgi:hypothetical protein